MQAGLFLLSDLCLLDPVQHTGSHYFSGKRGQTVPVCSDSKLEDLSRVPHLQWQGFVSSRALPLQALYGLPLGKETAYKSFWQPASHLIAVKNVLKSISGLERQHHGTPCQMREIHD